MNIKGFKAKDGNVYKYDFNELANLPETPEGGQGADGGYYTPAVTQPTADTIQFDFTPSKAGMPAVEPVQVKLPAGSGSGGNGDQSGLSSTASELLITILRNGVYNADQSANITALAAELAVTEEEEPDTPVEPDEPVTPEKTLSSISATYSGGDVTVGTAVSSLTGIVVTAHYSDGTSATVTGYTLSGTIAEGENTVTVSYGGLTTTFTVTGVAESGGEGTEVAMTRGETSCTIYSDNGETELRGGNSTYYVSDEVFEEDTVVTITVLYGVVNTALKQYAACAPADSVASGYYGEEIGAASTNEYQVAYTVKAGYRLLIKNYNTGVPKSITVTK